MSSVPAVVEQPRPFGYVVGDLIEQRVLLQTANQTVDLKTLPRAGRLNVWLERRAPQIASDSQGRRWLVLDYQLINAPQGLTTINLPAWQLGTATGQTLSIPPWPVSVGPLTGRTVIAQGGLQALRADRPAPMVPTQPIARQLEIWSGAFFLALVLWAGWLAWRNWRDARSQPFARAAREMRNVGEDSPQAWQALHRAFDRTAGRVVQVATLPSLFEAAGHLEPLRPRIEAFFSQSVEYFFGGGAGGAGGGGVGVRELCGELRRYERRHHR